jgi:hypothetical protein
VRLGTASLASCGGAGGPFIKAERLDMRKYAARPNLARVLCDYIIYVVRGRYMLASVWWHACVPMPAYARLRYDVHTRHEWPFSQLSLGRAHMHTGGQAYMHSALWHLSSISAHAYLLISVSAAALNRSVMSE